MAIENKRKTPKTYFIDPFIKELLEGVPDGIANLEEWPDIATEAATASACVNSAACAGLEAQLFTAQRLAMGRLWDLSAEELEAKYNRATEREKEKIISKVYAFRLKSAALPALEEAAYSFLVASLLYLRKGEEEKEAAYFTASISFAWALVELAYKYGPAQRELEAAG